jgi:hypothetical protein
MALVTELESRLDGVEVLRIHPGELVEPLKVKLHRDFLRPEWVGHLMVRNGFKKDGRDADGVLYAVSREQVTEVRRRYQMGAD